MDIIDILSNLPLEDMKSIHEALGDAIAEQERTPRYIIDEQIESLKTLINSGSGFKIIEEELYRNKSSTGEKINLTKLDELLKEENMYLILGRFNRGNNYDFHWDSVNNISFTKAKELEQCVFKKTTLWATNDNTKQIIMSMTNIAIVPKEVLDMGELFNSC